ncbi:GNAT family N-acetyltransferase [uncultured Roseobacter sp.]|uniref:GNAT family N-acetyltransferase n=1 Tax=uncultured Roseobacter sp. TaxID=114847 RepID=UPI002603CED7|nr:GNAT family N-acetyltransferase [uncultured Roseobacter sp.]
MTVLACETPSVGPAAALAAQFQSLVPVLETDRLRLRAPHIGEFEHYAAITVGTRGQYILEEQTREAAWYDFTQMIAGWTLRGHGLWTIERKSDGTALGFVLLGFEPGDPEPELGFMMRASAEGHGYAHEAAVAARDYGFSVLELPTLISTIDPANARSQRLAECLGAVRDGHVEATLPEDILVYRHPAPEGWV